MGRDRGPKHKISRREKKDLFGTGGDSLQRRLDLAPGQHSQRQRRDESEYSKQLRAKQMVKRMYGLRETQFERFFNIASRTREQTGLALLRLLELRLDNVVYRLGLARTRPQARQFVTHGMVKVDGQRVNIPSYIMKTGQRVELKDHILRIPDVLELIDSKVPVPGWLQKDDKGGQVMRDPDRQEIDADIEEQRIVEFYSR